MGNGDTTVGMICVDLLLAIRSAALMTATPVNGLAYVFDSN